MHDLIVRNGTIVDGTGRPSFEGDVAVEGDRIVAVGQIAGRGREEIDAKGLLVTPGWVDMHTHYDGQVTWDPHLTPSGWHGVTTVVMGNCGVGFAPVRPSEHEWLIQVMEGVEDIPGSALSEGIRWGWESFPEYLDAIDTPHALDFATQIPHSALRGYVMGAEASERENATAEQVARMKALVKEALLAGALGFSTSRTSLHKTSRGVFVAGTFAPIDELRGIAEALGETGLGVFEIADEHLQVPQDAAWMEEIATKTGRPVVFNLSQTDFAPQLWQEGLAKVEAAAQRGAPLYAQVAGRAIGIWMNLQATAHPFALHPTWQELAKLPWPERLDRLKRAETRAALLAEKPAPAGMFETWIVQAWDKMYAFSGSADYEPSREQSLAAIAAATGRPPAEIAYDLLMAGEGTGFLYFPLFNYANGDLEILRGLHSHPRTLMGLSDGGAHCGAICDGGMPTFMLTHWARDRARGGKLALEHVVKRQTADTAAFYGLRDRGVVAPGWRADLNVIDFDSLALDRPTLAFDLPAGGRRLVQTARGYRATICRGQTTFLDGVPTGTLPGRLVRGPQALA
jgi:N-acyl-D-amino-acid deacylase